MILNMGYQIELHVMLMLNWVMTLPTDDLGFFCIYQYCSFLTVFFCFGLQHPPRSCSNIYIFNVIYPDILVFFEQSFAC